MRFYFVAEQSAEIILTDRTRRCCAALMLPEALLPVLPVVPLDAADVLVPELVVDPDPPEVESTVPVTSTLWPTWFLSSLSFPFSM